MKGDVEVGGQYWIQFESPCEDDSSTVEKGVVLALGDEPNTYVVEFDDYGSSKQVVVEGRFISKQEPQSGIGSEVGDVIGGLLVVFAFFVLAFFSGAFFGEPIRSFLNWLSETGGNQ